MSNCPWLPQEILDQIIDLLQDKPETLNHCCLVSKSWVPRTRKYLFAHVEITREWDLHKWEANFPDPMESPAYHTHTLTVDGAFGAAGKDSWIYAFPRVERLFVTCGYLGLDIGNSLLPFGILAPSLKSLHVNSIVGTPHSQISGLIQSLPLLEDLALQGVDLTITNQGSDGPLPAIISPSLSLAGTLNLYLEDMERSLHLLLDLPGGLRFRKLALDSWCNEKHFPLVRQLVAACSSTLECLDIACKVDGKCTLSPINLSAATKLKDIAIRCGSLSIGWTIMTLKTIRSKHLRQISICLPYAPSDRESCLTIERMGVADHGMRWSDLDRLLVKFSESHSIRSKVLCPRGTYGKREAKDWVGHLLPESSSRGVVHVVDVFFKPRW